MNANQVAQISVFTYFGIYFWVIAWTGFALWRAANLKQRNWFIAILVLNLFVYGILGIVYLFFFANKKLTLGEIKSWFVK